MNISSGMKNKQLFTALRNLEYEKFRKFMSSDTCECGLLGATAGNILEHKNKLLIVSGKHSGFKCIIECEW